MVVVAEIDEQQSDIMFDFHMYKLETLPTIQTGDTFLVSKF